MPIEKVTLRSVLDSLESGSRPRGGVRGITEGVPSLGGEHVDAMGGLRLDRMRFVPKAFFERMQQGQIRANDILVVKDGATTGRVALVPGDFPLLPAVANEHLFVCRAAEAVAPEYLFYYLLSPLGQRQIMENFRGSAQGGIVQSFADGVRVPLPDPAVQEATVDRLREALSGVDRIAAKVARVGPRVDAAGEAIARAFFRGDIASAQRGPADAGLLDRLTRRRLQGLTGRAKARGVLRPERLDPPPPDLPQGWVWASLDQLIETGPQNGLYKPQTAYGEGVEIVRIEDFQNGAVRARDELSRLRVSDSEQRRFALRRGDIVINRVNSPSHLGKSFLVPDDLDGVMFESNMMRLRIVDDVSPSWVARYLQSAAGRESLLRNAKWAVNQASINQTDVRSVPVPLAAKAEQAAVMRKLDQAYGLVPAIRRRVESAEAGLAELRTRLLAQAFAGPSISPGTRR